MSAQPNATKGVELPKNVESPKSIELSKNPSALKQVKNIDWNNRKYIRAGVIPFVQRGEIRFFGFGVENGVAAIGDFGGHYENKDRDLLDTAIREYNEEAFQVFGELNREMLQNCYVLEGNDTLEILLPVRDPFYQYTQKFHELVGSNIEHEVQSIVWLSRRQVLTAIDSQESAYEGTKIYHMYSRIRDTLHKNREFL
ncbi:Hypothetical protein HVR_LOCUS167 [uncultured virus]|nr:Hypothetical protein HVR_LOCUS167 [uncultured virus]